MEYDLAPLGCSTVGVGLDEAGECSGSLSCNSLCTPAVEFGQITAWSDAVPRSIVLADTAGRERAGSCLDDGDGVAILGN